MLRLCKGCVDFPQALYILNSCHTTVIEKVIDHCHIIDAKCYILYYRTILLHHHHHLPLSQHGGKGISVVLQYLPQLVIQREKVSEKYNLSTVSLEVCVTLSKSESN